MPFVPNGAKWNVFTSMFSSNVTADYCVEYDAERMRLMHYPIAPSRFSCIYAFGNEDDCQTAHRFYNWPLEQVRRFQLLDSLLNRVWRTNMEVVSLMRAGYRSGYWSEEEMTRIWRHYWSGRGTFTIEVPAVIGNKPSRHAISSGEVWECLIEGRRELVDQP